PRGDGRGRRRPQRPADDRLGRPRLCRGGCARGGGRGGGRPDRGPAGDGGNRAPRGGIARIMATLFLVHAHPDDEAVSTGGVLLRAHEAGHRVVLVTSTRGEEGEIYNMDEAEARPRLAEIRTEELR